MKDYYEILGLYDDASQEEILERWAVLTHKHHPDRLESGYEEKIKEINEAYEVLKDPAIRFEYDLQRDLKKSVLKKRAYEKRKRNIRLSKILPAAAIAVFLLGVVAIYFIPRFQGPTRQVEHHPIAPPKPQGAVQAGKELQPSLPPTPLGPEAAAPIPKPSEAVSRSPSAADAGPLASAPPVSKPGETIPIAGEIARKPADKEAVALAPSLREEAAKLRVPPSGASKAAEPVRVAEKPVREPAKREEIAPLARQIPRERAAAVSPGPAPAEPARIPSALTPSPKPAEPARPVRETPPREPSRAVLPAKPSVAPAEMAKAEVSRPAPSVPPRVVAPSVSVPTPAPKPVEPASPVRETPREVIREIPPAKPSIAPAEMAKAEVPRPAPSEPPRAVAPSVPVPAPAAKPEEPAKTASDFPREPALPPFAKEEEVREFLTRYANQYVGKNVEGFLSFFSPQAVQNQRYDYNAIKSMYTKFFEESQRLKYRIKPEAIEISSREAKIRGTYQIEQETKSGQFKEWMGNIQWTLVREQGALKVRTLQYRHTPKP